MTKNEIVDAQEDIKKFIDTQKAVIGAKKTIKALKSGKIEKVFTASNAEAQTKDDLKKYSGIAQVELLELSVKNDELGSLCKKPFSISVLGKLK